MKPHLLKKLLLLLALITNINAHAADFGLKIGETRFVRQHDGVWCQDAFPCWMDLSDKSLSIDVSEQLGAYRYRLAFTALGNSFSNGLATSDGTYNPHFVATCGHDCGLHNYTTRGSESGVSLSVMRPLEVFGLPLYVEAGIYAHITKLQVTLTKPNGDFIAEVAREPAISFGPLLGVGLRYNGLDISLSYYYLDSSSETDPITTLTPGAWNFGVGAYF